MSLICALCTVQSSFADRFIESCKKRAMWILNYDFEYFSIACSKVSNVSHNYYVIVSVIIIMIWYPYELYVAQLAHSIQLNT